MVNTKINLSMTEPYVRQIYAKQGDTGRVLEIGLEDATLENGTLRILRPDGLEKTSDAVSSDSPTITDGMASFDSLDEAEVTSLKVGISPIQDLHGYANPWPSGGGKNKWKPMTSKTVSGVTFAVSDFGVVTLNNTSTALILESVTLPSQLPVGTYTLSANNSSTNSNVSLRIATTASTNAVDLALAQENASVTFTVTDPITAVTLRVANNTALSNFTISPQLESGSTATSYAPYSNICPIYAGNGKNLLNNTASSSSPSGITFTVNADGTVTATGTATADAQLQIPFSGLSGDYYFCGCPSDGNASTKYDVYAWDITVGARFKKWNGTTNSASDVGTYSLQEIQIPSGHSGYIVIRIKSGYAIQDSLLFKPMICRPTEVDSTYVPYQGINIYEVGANQWDEEWELGIINSAGGNSPDSTSIRSTNYISILPSKTYCVVRPTGKQIFYAEYDANRTFIRRTGLSTANDYATFTSDANAHYLKFCIVAYGTTYNNDISINFPSTITSYEPYLSHTYPISLGQSVYGGTLDVVGGKLTINKGFAEFDGSNDEDWTVGSANAVITIADMESGSNMSGLSNQYEIGTTSGKLRLGNSNNRIYIVSIVTTQGITTVADLRTSLSANPLQVVYPLATPLEVDLTPTQITTLLGQNNIWADGEISELTFDYGKLLSVLTADQTEVVGRCLGDVNFGGASTMPFSLIVKPNNKENA